MAITNIFITVLKIFIIFTLISCVTCKLKCADLGSDTGGYTLPSGDITLRYGDPLDIVCSLYEANGDNDSSKLKFLKHNETVPKDYIEVLNATSIRLHIEKHPKTSSDTYYCISEGTNNAVCLNLVLVGTAPQDVTDFKCLGLNYEQINCTWTAPNNYVMTTYNLTYSVELSNSQQGCPGLQMRDNRYSCVWSISTKPQYRQSHKNFVFHLTMANALGTKEQNFEIPTWNYVIPKAPQNLVGKALSPHSIKLTWIKSMISFPPGTHHRVSIYENYSKKWRQVALIKDALRNQTLQYTLTDLKYAHTLYDIRVSMRSAFANNSDDTLWSQNASITIWTKSSLPDRPPKTNVGSFEVINKKDSRDIYVYWQKINEEEQNGENFTYQVKIVGDPLHLPKELNKAYAKFEDLLTGIPYTFQVWSANEVGSSKEYSIVRVPSDQERIRGPINVIKYSHKGNVHEIKWEHPVITGSPITNYTVYWCSNIQDRPFQCGGNLNWETVPNTTTSYNRTFSDGHIEQFAVSTNSIDGSSGMSWAECTIIPRDGGKITNIFVGALGSTWINLGWMLGCADKIGSVTGYEILYCPTNEQKRECQETAKSFKVKGDSKTTSANLTGLIPNKTYRLQVSVIVRRNSQSVYSDPIYYPTLEGTPTAPRNINVSNITSNSMIVSWDEPEELNGHIKEYKVIYNNSEIKADYTKLHSTIKIENLKSFGNYKVYVVACVVSCSEPSAVLNVTTLISKPSKISQPIVSQKSGQTVMIKWQKPYPPNGKVDYYELKLSNDKNDTKNVTTESDPLTCNKEVYVVVVRAVNIDFNGKKLYGDWSDELEYDCGKKDTYILYLVFAALIFAVVLVAFVFKKICTQYRGMKDLNPKLPAGLDSELFEDKPPSPSPSKKLLDIGSELRDSSGCSSGQESIASSLQSTTNLSTSDSGTEQLRSSSLGKECTNSLRKRNPGYVLPETLPQTARSPPEAYVVFGGDTQLPPESPDTSPYIPFSDTNTKPYVLADLASDYNISPNITKSGCVPFTTAEPQFTNTGYVVAGIPPPSKNGLMTELVRKNSEEEPLYVPSAHTIEPRKNMQLWRDTSTELPKTGYVFVGEPEVPISSKTDIGLNVNLCKGYVPHKAFEAKSIKED